MIRYFQSCGDLDENRNITEKGKSWGLTEDWLNGTETEEHYQQYLKDWNDYMDRYFAWLKNDGNPDNLPTMVEKP